MTGDMTLSQYRCIVAHMMFWKRGLDEAARDSGVALAKDEIAYLLFRVGHRYDEATDTLVLDV